MFGKNNTKMNSTKQSEKINQYGIKKFNAGTASVLIASGFLFLGGAAQAAETTKQETPVETTARDKSTEKVETPKAEVAEKTAEKTVGSTVVKTSAVKTKLQEKINQLNDLFVTLAGKDLSETQQKLTVDAAIELNKAKDLIVDENATQAQVDAQTVALENSISFLNKSLEAKKIEDKKVEDKKAEDKKEAKSEGKSDKKENKSEKEELEKTISEAKVINQTATAFAEKSVKEESKKAEIKAAVATAEKQIAKALDVFNSDSSTKSDSERERKELERAIEAVYATMQRAGHRGKLEGLLAGETTANTAIVAPTTKTPVKNINELTDEEVAAVKREIMNTNPSITDPSMIEVVKKGNGTAGEATVTLNGVKTNIPSGDTVVGTAGTKNLEQLKNNINWFDFAAASITYSNGTVVGPARKLAQPITKTVTYPNGDTVTGKITMVRDVTYADGSKGLTTDDKFLNSGTAKYVEHLYYTGGAQNDHELYEALQEGMKFNVKTKVEGYALTATVIKLGSKDVQSDPNRTPAGPVNAVRDYGDWGSEKQLAKAQAEDKKFKENATKNKTTFANNPTVSVNGVALTLPEYPTETFANTDAYYAKAAAYNKAIQDYNKAIDAQKLSATKLSETGFTYINVNGKAVPSGSANLYKKIGNQRQADVLITSQDTQWSYLRKAGLPTTNPDGSEMLTAFTSSRDESNVGVTFALSATYNGRIVDVNVIAADAEEAGKTEIVQFETDGTKWEQFMALNLQKDIDDKTAQGVYPSRPSDVNADGRLAEAGYNPKDWVNVDEKGNPSAYGTNTFGANVTSMGSKNSLPIALSQNVKTLSMYLNSAGAQAGTIGFMIYDGGDAPQSYGSAQHIIGDFNKEVVKNGVKTQVTATQPYLGSVKGDPDFRSTKTDPSGGWVLDDLITSEKYKETPLESGKTIVTTEKGVTGKYLLLPNGNAVIEKEDQTRVLLNQGDVIEMANPQTKLPIRGIYNHTTGALGEGTLGDEGESQLLDPAVATEYKLRQAQGNEYVLEGVRANLGVNNDKAYIRGWVDFNNNGKFDLNESSEIVEVNQNGTYNIRFKNTPQLLDTSADSLGVRLRISLTKDEILEPTGVASSGEVEDFETHVIHMPRGTKHETSDYQGREQTVKLPTNAMFLANGKNKDSKYKQWAQIENENLPPKIVLTDKQVASEEAYTPTDSELPSNYRKGTDGKIFVERNGATVFTGEYVTVKDKNNKVLGKALKITNPLNKKTEYLLDSYTEYDTAGNEVGTYKVNPASNGKNVSIGNGLYETTLTFQPNKSFVGTAKGIAVRAWDDNNSSTGWEATSDTIETSKTSTTLAEKDKVLENVNNGNNGYKSMDTSYIPTVIDVRPVGKDTTTEDVQGKPQSSNPEIPTKGTVETVTNESVETSKQIDILNTSKKPTFATKKEIPGKVYTEDTKVDKETEVTLPNGKTATFKPADKIPANTRIADTGDVTVSGTGDVLVSNVRYGTGSVPAGAILEGAEPTVTEPTTVLRNGANVVIPIGSKVQKGDQLVTPLKIAGGAQITTWKKTYQNGETIPKVTADKFSVLANETSADQLVPKGEGITLNGTTYNANNDIVPKGSREATKYEDLMNVTLPDAVHIDPETGEVETVHRRYTKVTDTEIVIENEGTYTLNQDTGEITFTPHPKFVGKGTGVTKQQPDIDYNDKVAGDPVTSKYGTDYGKATYTPIVNPQTKASITRTIHYVYENDNDNPSSQDSYKDNDPIVAIDNTPVTRTQTIDYTRDYKIFSEAGTTDTAITTANQVTDATGHVYKVGDTIPAGTKFNQGSIIIGKWTASSDQNSKFKEIISPTVKGYTAEVVTANFTNPDADGKMGHIHNGKQPVGLYTPVADNTKDVGAYEPLVSEVRADDKDDFDMYVVYKADKQKAKVTYIDLDATGDDRILEVQNANPAPATGADAKTTYGVTTLEGKSHTAIPYTTAETIKKYEDLGYELVTDDYTNNTQGTAIEGGRKFDDDKEVDQAFNVYLRHKKVLRQIKDTQEVTRTIEYKYASTEDVPADKRGTTAAPTVTETLHYERDRTIDYTLAAKEYPTEYAAYKAVLDKSGYDSPEEYKARTVYYDHITNKAIAADATPAQKAIVTFGPWTPVGGTSNDAITLSDAEKAKDDKFNLVNSPEVTGYTPDNATVEATAAIDAEADDYKITVLYTPVAQKAVVKFVEVDPTNTDKVITPGLADPISVTGKSEAAYPATTATSVTDKIAELVKKGYELVDNGFKPTDKFDKDAAVDQEYVVKFKAKVVDIPSFDPTKPESNDNPKPTPGVTPIDPNNPDGPKWTEALINAVKVQEEVTRTIKYVYEDGTPVAESDLTSVADKKVKTLKFTRSGKINVAAGEITYGNWSADQTFEAVTSPTLEKYTAAVAGVTPAVADVPAKTVAATDKDFEETVIYSTKPTTVDPNKPTDPTNPNVTPQPDDVVPNDPKGRTYRELGLIEEVTHTVHYKLEDGSDAGIADNVQTLTFTRTAEVDPVTGAISNYGTWKAKGGDTTIDAVTTPNKDGYVASAKTSTERTNVQATDKDSEETIIFRKLGKYVPVVPEGITPPAGADLNPKPYPNATPAEPTKPGTPTEKPVVPYIPGTTPVGPNGKPLTPKDPNDPTKGYEVPDLPTDPTENTTITYVKDGSQVAVTHFIEVNSETDKTEKGAVAESVVDTGDTGKAFTKAADVTSTIEALKAKGYTVVENNYPTDGKFDADAKTNQVYKVLVTAKPITVNPNDPTPTPGKPIDPNNEDGPKWTPELIKELEDGRKEEVKRTIKYVYADGSKAADTVQETKEFKRSATINPVTGKITFGDWSPAQTFEAVTSPKVTNFTPDKESVPAAEVTATAEDINETVIYTTKPITLDPSKPTDPNNPTDPNTNVTPKPDDRVPNDPKGRTYKELGLIEEVTHTVHYKLADGSDAGIPDNVQTLTFTRTADLDPVTGAISNFGEWKAKGDDTTIDAITTPNKPGYVASAAKSTERTNVQATDKDSEETIIYRKLGSYVPVIPEGVTPPANTDLTPKPYPNDPKDPTKPGTPAETPVVPYIPGTTPIGPNGKPLTPKDPNDPTKGYEVPKVPEDPTQDTRITYVKDGSQVALVHFIKADGTAVHVSVAEAGETGKAIKTTNIDNVKAELEAKGYEVVAPTDPAYTAERVAFYADANRTYDDKDDKGDSGVSQVYYVIVKEGITPIDPDKPLDPNNPNVTPKPGDKVPGDPKQRTFEQLGLLDEVNRTINYRYANTDKVEEAKRGQEAAATVEQKLRYSRKGDLNKVTGEITYTSDWTKPQTLAEVASPVIEGYVADIKAAEKVENVAHDAADSVVNVVYSPLGKYVPKVPEGFEVPKLEKPQYPNDPTDPTKPGTPTTVIPHVPGTTPKDPNGNPLKPVDPNDPTKGYVPPTPENPTEDTQITYEKDTQKAKVTYVVEGTGTVLHTDNLEGKSGEPIEYSTVAKLAELKALGYDLVTDGFTTATDKNYDKDTKVDQSFVVTVKPHLEPLKPVDPENPNDPNRPKPGQPIDPNNPDGPKWTEDLIKQIDTTRHVNRTIKYVNEKGEEVAKKVTDKVTFTREGKINAVTGVITYGDWTAKDKDTTFDKVESPVVKGYILKDAKQKEVAATTGLTADSKDENIEVVYTKLGSWVPKVPEGVTPIDPTPYPNDPKDPTKPGNDRPIVPYVPGTTPKVPQDPTKPVDPKTNPLVPLTPVDPQDPTKGYEVPPVPTEPGKDTPITYEKDEQRATVKYVVEGTGTVLHTDNLKGKSGEPIEYSTVAKLAELKALGYDLVTDGFTTATDKNFDKDSSKDQEYTVVLTQHSEPLKPVDPENPNDPNRPKPGQPIDPNNPDGPKWTEDLIKQIDTTRHVNRTIKYVNEKGEEVAKKVTDKVTFTREGKINAVTGVITYGDWTAKDKDTTFDKVESPVVKGYILKDAKQKEVAATTGLTADSKDENIEVVYTKLGSWVPKVPEGSTPIKPTPYPNDPKDPTKPGNDRPIVPYVPGTTPVVPKDPTKPISPDNPLVPLTPVDPKDPTKGYEVPPVPTDPSADTPINYVTDKQKAITNFVTETGKVVSTPVVDEGDSGANFTKSKVDEVTKTIEKLEKAGYRVVKNDFPSKDTDRVFDKDKSVDQIFNVTVAERIIPVTPGKPVDPNDPNLPKNPDGTPVTPSTPEPGKPVFPNDPNSPVWPSTVKDLVTEKSATRTIKYVDRNGKEVTETRTETIKFTRDAKINLVTGEITYGEWTTDRNDDIFNGYPVPVVKGYIAKDGDLESSTKDVKVTPDTIKDINETVVYDKLGSWVPNIPGTPTNPIPYPNDPKDPTKPGSDKPIVPYVPGHTPMVPQDPTKPVGPNNPLVPLKPVDPNDPTKGYEVPNVPNDPTKDTPISYVPVPQPTPKPTPKPTPTTPVTPETPKAPEAPVAPKAPTQVKRLANTGTTETNTGLAGLGMAIFGGLLAAVRRRKNNED